jgi:hypothetical protein
MESTPPPQTLVLSLTSLFLVAILVYISAYTNIGAVLTNGISTTLLFVLYILPVTVHLVLAGLAWFEYPAIEEKKKRVYDDDDLLPPTRFAWNRLLDLLLSLHRLLGYPILYPIVVYQNVDATYMTWLASTGLGFLYATVLCVSAAMPTEKAAWSSAILFIGWFLAVFFMAYTLGGGATGENATFILFWSEIAVSSFFHLMNISWIVIPPMTLLYGQLIQIMSFSLFTGCFFVAWLQ